MIKTPLSENVVKHVVCHFIQGFLLTFYWEKTQNSNKELDSLIWSKCPKKNFHLQEKLTMPIANITLDAAYQSQNYKKEPAGLSPSLETEKRAREKDAKRLMNSDARATLKYKIFIEPLN